MHRVLALTLLFATTAYAGPDARHVDAIRTAATAYKKWRRVDETPNFAPVLCRSPLPKDWGTQSHIRMSAADDAPHGRKLYYLWASDKKLYLDGKSTLPVGFTIVKESFDAVPSKPSTEPSKQVDLQQTMGDLPPIDSMVTSKGEHFRTGKPKDLFIMTKVGDLPGSDAGWIYGTVAPDGTVTSAGRVANCMGCHVESATHERLFGLTAAPKS
jgi:hypothetical protein